MEVILLEKVENLGNLGDKVKVKPGYGRNFLVPRGKAAPATVENLKAFEARRAELEQASAEALAAAQQRADALNKLGGVTLTCPAGDEGKLFGSVGTADISEALSAAGVAITKQEVRLPEGSLRQVGEYSVGIHLHTDIDVDVTVTIEAEA